MNYCVVITSGEFADFGIERMYMCDHPIDPKEWDAEMQAYNERVRTAQVEIFAKRGLRLGYDLSKEAHAECIAFREANHPLPAFVEKHKLVPIEHVELWTWGL